MHGNVNGLAEKFLLENLSTKLRKQINKRQISELIKTQLKFDLLKLGNRKSAHTIC